MFLLSQVSQRLVDMRHGRKASQESSSRINLEYLAASNTRSTIVLHPKFSIRIHSIRIGRGLVPQGV